MDIQRMIALNRYTTEDIEDLADVTLKTSPVVFVGNVMEFRKLKQCVENRIPISIISPICTGKYTAAIKVCEQLGLSHEDSYNGLLLDDAPLVDTNTVFIIRNPKKSQLLEQYINTDGRLILLYDNVDTKPLTQEIIRLNTPTLKMIEQYKEEKGIDMYIAPKLTKVLEKQIIAKNLKRGCKFPIPNTTHRWLMYNFPKNEKILRICSIAEDFIDEPEVYYGLCKLIRHRKNINLVYPKWSKMKSG